MSHIQDCQTGNRMSLGTKKVQRNVQVIPFTYNGNDYGIHVMDMLLEKTHKEPWQDTKCC